MQLISETANTGAGMSGGQPALSTGISSRQGCKRAVGLQQGGDGTVEMPAAEIQCSPAWIAMNFTAREKPGLKCEI